MSDGSRHAAYLVPETVYATTPTTPSMLAIRHTGFTLGMMKKTLQSTEIRADRQIADFRMGSQQIGGAIDFEPAADATFEAMLEASLCGIWAGSELKADVVRRSFSVLRYFSDMASGGKPYHLFTGVEFGGFKLKCTADAMVTGSFSVLGKSMALSTTAPAGATLGTPSVTSPMDSFSGALTEGGSTLAVVTEVELSLENALAPRFVVGSKTTIRPSIGRSNMSGKMTAYFEDSSLVDKFINETSSSLQFVLTAGANSYTFKLGNIKYTGGQPDVKGEGPITLAMPWQAVYDPDDLSQIVITKV